MNAIMQIKKYISERKKCRNIDVENIHGMHVGHDRGLIKKKTKTLFICKKKSNSNLK